MLGISQEIKKLLISECAFNVVSSSPTDTLKITRKKETELNTQNLMYLQIKVFNKNIILVIKSKLSKIFRVGFYWRRNSFPWFCAKISICDA
jgi:hypothetical protein